VNELLRVEGVRKHRGGRLVVASLALTIRAGERLVLFGGNGSGKSTVIGLVVGLLAPERGTVAIGGARLDRDREKALRNLGYAPDRPDVPDQLRVDEWLALIASLRAAAVPSAGELAPLRIAEIERFPLRALSLGQRRRVAIATALVGRPPLLVLDEPTIGLDAEAIPSLRDLLVSHGERGGGVLCATHDASFAAAIATSTVRLPL
jgi:ABC-2 type transport system ATP-binding protein